MPYCIRTCPGERLEDDSCRPTAGGMTAENDDTTRARDHLSRESGGGRPPAAPRDYIPLHHGITE